MIQKNVSKTFNTHVNRNHNHSYECSHQIIDSAILISLKDFGLHKTKRNSFISLECITFLGSTSMNVWN